MKPRGDVEPAHVDLPVRRKITHVSYGHDALASDRHIAQEPGVPGAVQDAAVAEDEVRRSAVTLRRTGLGEGGCHPDTGQEAEEQGRFA